MINVKIILLLSLAAYVACGAGPSRKAASCIKAAHEEITEAEMEARAEVEARMLQLYNKIIAELYPDQPKAAPREKTEADLKDDEIIEEAFKNCKIWSREARHMTMYNETHELISKAKYYSYMGDNEKDWTFINSYFKDLTPKNPDFYFYIDSQLFHELFKTHCHKLQVSVEAFANEREDATGKKKFDLNSLDPFFKSIRNPARITLTDEPYPYLFDEQYSDQPREKTETEIIEEAFRNCKLWSGQGNPYNWTHECISEIDYYSYMGDNDKDWTLINSYFKDLTPKKTAGCFYIDSQSFNELFKLHCQKLEVSFEAFANKRKYATEKKEFDLNSIGRFFESNQV